MIDRKHPNNDREQEDCELMIWVYVLGSGAYNIIDAQDMVDSTCLAVLEGHSGRVTHLRRGLTQCSLYVSVCAFLGVCGMYICSCMF